MIFDTHAHYDHESFDADREELFENLPKKGVFAVINVSVDLNSSKKSIKYAEKYPYVYAGLGIHPQEIDEKTLEHDFLELQGMFTHEKIRGVGEIGLDYHYNCENKVIQKRVFERQLEIAAKNNLPVMVHDRDAHEDMLEILRKHRPKGVLHCFSGGPSMAEEVLSLGMKIGISGIITFKNAHILKEVVEKIPLEGMLLETDAPYLAPEPFRGKRCDSSLIKFTAEKIAEIKNISTRKVLEVTKKNAAEMFLKK